MKPKLIPTIITLIPTLVLIPSILKNTTTKYSFVNKFQSNYGMLKQQDSQTSSQDINQKNDQDLNQGDNDNSGIDEEEKSKKPRKEPKKKKNTEMNQENDGYSKSNDETTKSSSDQKEISQENGEESNYKHLNENDNDNSGIDEEEKLKNPTKTYKQKENNIKMNQENDRYSKLDYGTLILDYETLMNATIPKQQEIRYTFLTEFLNQYNKLNHSKRKKYGIKKFCNGSLDKTSIEFIFYYMDKYNVLREFTEIFFDGWTLESILDLDNKLNNEKDIETKNESLWTATLDGKIGSLDNKLFIHQFDKAKDSIPSNQLKLLIENNLLNPETFLEIKKEIEKRDKQNNSNGKNKMEKTKMEKTKKDKLTKLECEFNKVKKQKSRKRKTLSLKDLLTKNDTEIDKNEKTDLLIYLFINHVITGSEIKHLVQEGKIDQKLYNEIKKDPIVKLQDKTILELTQKLLIWDCQQFLFKLPSKKFGHLPYTYYCRLYRYNQDSRNKAPQNQNKMTEFGVMDKYDGYSKSNDETTKSSSDQKEISQENGEESNYKHLNENDNDNSGIDEEEKLKNPIKTTSTNEQGVIPKTYKQKEKNTEMNQENDETTKSSSDQKEISQENGEESNDKHLNENDNDNSGIDEEEKSKKPRKQPKKKKNTEMNQENDETTKSSSDQKEISQENGEESNYKHLNENDNDNSGIDEEEKSKKPRKQPKKKKNTEIKPRKQPKKKKNTEMNQENDETTKSSSDQKEISQENGEESNYKHLNENDNDNSGIDEEEKLKNPTKTTSTNEQGVIPKTYKQKEKNTEMNQENDETTKSSSDQKEISQENDNDNSGIDEEEKSKKPRKQPKKKKNTEIKPRKQPKKKKNTEMNQENDETTKSSSDQKEISQENGEESNYKHLNENDNDNIESHTEEIKEIDIIYITEFANQYKQLDQSKSEEYVINEFLKGSLDKTTIKYIFDNKYLDNDILPQFKAIFFNKATLNSILRLYNKLNNEKDTDTKNESLWKATLDGKLGSLNTNSFIHQFDKAKDSIPSDQLELLLENDLIDQKTLHQIKEEIQKRDEQNSSNGKNKMEKTKKDKLTKLEREFNKLEVKVINNQSNEIDNKKQKSTNRKTLSLKDLLTKNDTEIDKKEKTDLLIYLFINHVITGSEIKDLVKDGKIDQTLYNEIKSYPEVVKLQDRTRLDLTQKFLLWDCHEFLLTLPSKKFGHLPYTYYCRLYRYNQDSRNKAPRNQNKMTEFGVMDKYDGYSKSNDETTKSSSDQKEISQENGEESNYKHLNENDNDNSGIDEEEKLKNPIKTTSTNEQGVIPKTYKQKEKNTEMNQENDETTKSSSDQKEISQENDNDNSGIDEEEKSKKPRKQPKKKKNTEIKPRKQPKKKKNTEMNQENDETTKSSSDQKEISQENGEESNYKHLNENDNDNSGIDEEEKLKNPTKTTSTNEQGVIPKTYKQKEKNTEMNQENDETTKSSSDQKEISQENGEESNYKHLNENDNDNSGIDEEEKSKKPRKQPKKKKKKKKLK